MSDESLELVPEDILAGRAVPQEMIVALRVIAELDSRTAKNITKYLSSVQGITATKEVRDGIQRLLPEPDADEAKIILQTLLNVRQNDVPRTITLVDRWRQSSEERAQFFSDSLFARLITNLKTLAVEHSSIALIRKANSLLRAVGNELDEVACFCDMRPVFDKERKKIDGFVVLANLRMLYRSQDGAQHAIEVALTEDELRDVIKVSSDALAKMEVLKTESVRIGQRMKG